MNKLLNANSGRKNNLANFLLPQFSGVNHWILADFFDKNAPKSTKNRFCFENWLNCSWTIKNGYFFIKKIDVFGGLRLLIWLLLVALNIYYKNNTERGGRLDLLRWATTTEGR